MLLPGILGGAACFAAAAAAVDKILQPLAHLFQSLPGFGRKHLYRPGTVLLLQLLRIYFLRKIRLIQ